MNSAWEEGTPDRPICILGEAPAKTEIAWKRPLVGMSGQVFDDCARSAQMPRQWCYILNLFPFIVEKKSKGDETIYKHGRPLYHPKTGFTADGLEASEEQIDKLKRSGCNVVIPLGRPATHRLTGDQRPLMKWRGSPLWSNIVDKKFIPTVHPAGTLWGGPYWWRYLIENDFAKALLEIDSPKLELPQRDIHIAPTLQDVFDFMVECKEQKRFATDLEVINHQVSCMSLATAWNRALVIPFVSDTGMPYWSEEDEISIWLEYNDLMRDPEIMKINQNIVGFDAPFLLRQNHIHTHGPIGDTMIAQHILYPHFNKGLDFIASYHTREPYWKDEGKIWKKVNIPWDVFQRYCGKDAAVALEAWDILEKELTDGDFWPTYNMTLSMREPLTYMAVRGLSVNAQGLTDTKKLLEAEMEIKQTALDAITGGLNPNSPKACKEYFYEKLGLKPYLNGMGGVTTDDKAMARIARKADKGSEEAKLVQEIRKLKKLKGTYIDVQLDGDGRLRSSWNPRGTWTGRLSSSKTIFGTGMNLQNLHPQFKGFIVGG